MAVELLIQLNTVNKMNKYDAQTKVTFNMIGISETFTLDQLGYEDFDDDLIELWIQKDYEAWIHGNSRGSWKIEQAQQCHNEEINAHT